MLRGKVSAATLRCVTATTTASSGSKDLGHHLVSAALLRKGDVQLWRQHQHQLIACCSQSTWTVSAQRTRTNNNSRRSTAPPPQQRRPLVNGEAVAFHVRDLPPMSTPPRASKNNAHHEYYAQQSPGWHRHAYAPATKPRSYESDLVVLLDMDECLVHSQFLDAKSQHLAHQVHNNFQNNNGTGGGGVVERFKIMLPDGDWVHVHVRPHLQEFLETVTSRFETHIFTAAMEVYAKPVLDKLDPHNTMFARRWYREACHFDASRGAYVKNLDHFDLRRTVLVDNNPLSFIANPSNGVLVSSFYTDPHDSTLPAVLALLHELDEQRDVRPLLERRFDMETAIKNMDLQRTTAAQGKSQSFLF